MKNLDTKIIKSEPVPIADYWWFRTENEIDPLSGYLTEMSDDFKFSDEKSQNDTIRHYVPYKPPVPSYINVLSNR